VHIACKGSSHLAYYNFDIHELILTIFGRNVLKKVRNQKILYSPNILTTASTLSGETVNPEAVSFHLKLRMLLLQQIHKTHSHYKVVTVKPPIILKTIHFALDRTKEGSIAFCHLLLICLIFTKSVNDSLC